MILPESVLKNMPGALWNHQSSNTLAVQRPGNESDSAGVGDVAQPGVPRVYGSGHHTKAMQALSRSISHGVQTGRCLRRMRAHSVTGAVTRLATVTHKYLFGRELVQHAGDLAGSQSICCHFGSLKSQGAANLVGLGCHLVTRPSS